MNKKKLPSVSAWENENNRAEKWKKKAIDRKKLLRRCKFIIDVCGVDWKDMTERFDSTLFDELVDELGDEGE